MKTRQKWIHAALAGVALTGMTGWADETEQRIGDLDQKIKVIERKLELAEESAQAKAKESAVLSAGKDGFALTAPDKSFELKLRGYVQSDARFYLNDEDKKAADTFLLRRVRPIFEGKVGQYFDFRLMPDFGGGSTVLQDAYVGMGASPALNLRIGKFKEPFGLERLQSGSDLLFIERGHPTSLSPNRDIGAQLGGDLGGGAFSYAFGVFNGVADGGSTDSDNDDGKEAVGRVFWRPFKDSDSAALKGLGIGVAATYGNADGSLTAPGVASYKSTGQQTFFSYRTSTNAADAVLADGSRTRVGPQAYYYAGPFGLLAEWTVSEQDVAKGNNSDTLQNTAWQVQTSWVLTGEDASYKGVKPRQSFDPAKGQWGALEVGARYTSLDVDDAAFPTFADPKKSASRTDTWGLAANWYLSKNVKLQVDYEQSAFDGGAASGDRPDERVVLARTQIAW